MRKFFAVLLSVMLLTSLAVLPATAESAVTLDNIKIGFVHRPTQRHGLHLQPQSGHRENEGNARPA
jgi:hypothetical protein